MNEPTPSLFSPKERMEEMRRMMEELAGPEAVRGV